MTAGDFDYKLFRKDWDNLLERSKYKEAEKLCHEGLAKSPLDQCRGRLYNHLGYLYENFLDDKTFDDILEHYVLSLQVDESNANSHYNLANFLLEQGMQHLLRSLELNPQHSKATKRFANLTPVKVNTTLSLDGRKYQVVEVVEDGVRAVGLTKRPDGQYERADNANHHYIEIGSPEKVVATKAGKGRTNNLRGNSYPAAMNIDDPNASEAGNSEKAGCCYGCVFKWWFWALLWILAIGGVVLPVLGYFDILEETECEEKLTASTVAINDDASTQGDLNVLFVIDCGASEWDDQFTAADTLLSGIAGTDSSVTINYDIVQYCDTTDTAYASLSVSDNGTFIEYDSDTTSSDEFSITQDLSSGGDNALLEGALQACSDTYDTYDDGDTTPFLCVPFMSQEFDDTFEAMAIAADSSFADIYLAFMVDEGDTDFNTSIYAVLGAFATGTECINRLDSDDAYDNTWWDAQFNCDSTTDEQAYCQHCINYANAAQLSCVGDELNGIFAGEGVTEKQINGSEEECSHSYESILFYCMAGVVPLLLWTCIAICVICRQSRCCICGICHLSKRSRQLDTFENSQSLNNNNHTQQAYV